MSREGASATLRGREFQEGMVRGKKENLNVLDDVCIWLYLREWDALVRDGPGVRYWDEGMSTRSWAILNIIMSWCFLLRDSKDSMPKLFSMLVTLL